MPEDLERLPRKPTEEQKADPAKRITERDRYRFQTKGRPDQGGYQRFVCPAEACKVRCVNKPLSLNLPPHNRPTAFDPPALETAPPVCVQGSTTFALAEFKNRQKHVWNSPQWHEAYKRRTTVERTFSGIKDVACEDLQRGPIRVLDRTKTTLMRCFRWVAHNLRMLDAFAERSTEPAPRRRQRRRTDTYP